METDINEIFRRNREEYPDSYDNMKWISPEEAVAATKYRGIILDDIFTHCSAKQSFSDTKLYTHSLSPGCRLCGQGDWSCLFINGVCNARCFYCPSSQKDTGPPMAHSLCFEHPDDYVQYVNLFQVKGVSFSGGEPFLSFDRVMAYLKALRADAEHPVYIWMYTNGILSDRDKLKKLRDAGLDEIRFDLSADDYRLDALEQAVGVIPCVTVEIPAIPEDMPETKQLLNTLSDMGVNHLNLHQIRCTPFNQTHLSKRGYSFVHGPKVTVPETELTALELIRYALDNDIDLPINYCSFTYRHQFQGAGARKRYAPVVKSGWEDITATGHIRRLKITGDHTVIEKVSNALINADADKRLYSLNAKKNALFFSATLWPLINFSGVELNVAYYNAAVKPAVSYRFSFKSISLKNGSSFVVEKQPAAKPGVLTKEYEIKYLGTLLNHPERFLNDQKYRTICGLANFETPMPGLAPYM